jgi:addiction module RelB/DinJ family antitoxin
MPTIVLKSRVDRSNAAAARRVLNRLGLKPSDAVNALFAQIASRKALPFSLATSDSSYAKEETSALRGHSSTRSIETVSAKLG